MPSVNHVCISCITIGPLAEIPEAEEEEQWQKEIRLSSSEGASTPVLDSRPDTRVVCISRARDLSGMFTVTIYILNNLLCIWNSKCYYLYIELFVAT